MAMAMARRMCIFLAGAEGHPLFYGSKPGMKQSMVAIVSCVARPDSAARQATAVRSMQLLVCGVGAALVRVFGATIGKKWEA